MRLARSTALRVLPEAMLERRRARLAADHFRSRGVAFIHVPRSAGTSINQALYGRFIGHFSLQHFLEASPEDVVRLPRFTVVRNPWDRLVSAYKFARAGGGSAGPFEVSIMRPSFYRRAEFADFSTFVRDYITETDIEHLDGVFRPQMYYIRDASGATPFDFIGRFGKLDETAEWLSDILKRRVELPRYNYTDPVDYRSFYDAETRDLVADFYATSIKEFGFEF